MNFLFTFLEGLSVASIERLYKDSITVTAIYRLLPPIAQYYIDKLLLTTGSTPFVYLKTLGNGSDKSTQNSALILLKNIRILMGQSGQVWLQEDFKRSFLRACCGELRTHLPHAPDARNLQLYSKELTDMVNSKWEMLLYRLVTGEKEVMVDEKPLTKNRKNTNINNEHFDDQLSQVLIGAKLACSKGGCLSITKEGFSFLLEDLHIQLWRLITQYLIMAEATGIDVVELLHSVFWICFAGVGAIVSPSATTIPPILMDFFTQVGIIVRLPGGKGENTFLLSALSSYLLNTKESNLSDNDLQEGRRGKGHIVVETNYKVYAYTSSPLEISILGLFVNLRDRFPNMVGGNLTGPSVQAAFAKGITASQLVTHLTRHLHLSMRAKNINGEVLGTSSSSQPLLPPVIEDQLYLWEKERDRLTTAEGYMYKNFSEYQDGLFKRAVQEGERLGCILYANFVKRILVVSMQGSVAMKAFIKGEVDN